MNNSKNLLDKTIELENKFLNSTFIAPVKGEVSVNVGGIKYRLKVYPDNYEGWAVLKPKDFFTANVIADPYPHQIYEYLKLCHVLRCILIKRLKGKTWMALPYNISDSMQRFRIKNPFVVHLVDNGDVFDRIKAAYDGANFWFESVDTGSSFENIEKMREGINNLQEEIRLKDFTREEKMAYSFVLWVSKEERVDQEEIRLKGALAVGGAKLSSYNEVDDQYVVKWKFEGQDYTTVVRKEDLTVVSSGICISGKDSLFDLSSIVGVMGEHSRR